MSNAIIHNFSYFSVTNNPRNPPVTGITETLSLMQMLQNPAYTHLKRPSTGSDFLVRVTSEFSLTQLQQNDLQGRQGLCLCTCIMPFGYYAALPGSDREGKPKFSVAEFKSFQGHCLFLLYKVSPAIEGVSLSQCRNSSLPHSRHRG